MPTKTSTGRGAKVARAARPSLHTSRAGPAASDPAVEALALDRRLAAIDTLEDRLIEIARSVPGRVTFSTSLGIEDQAVLNAIAASRAKIDVFTLDTGRHFPETLDTLEASQNRYGIDIRVMFPDAREVEELVARDGMRLRQGLREARQVLAERFPRLKGDPRKL